MLTIHFQNGNVISELSGIDATGQVNIGSIIWIDLIVPTDDERRKIEAMYSLNFLELKTENLQESNSRIYETESLTLINSNFLTTKDNYAVSTPCYFYLLGRTLISERDAQLVSFTETINKIRRNSKAFRNGCEILECILETKVDLDSDYLELLARQITSLNRKVSIKSSDNKEDLLIMINEFQESANISRESFMDKQHVVSALLKSSLIEDKERFKILIKDINSMLEYTSFLFTRLEYLQHTLLGLINLEQNKSIKIFTIVAVVFMPPTLIASIYGMNFRFMPELESVFGYPLALLLILSSSLLTLFIFKKKKWL